jgi:transposase InsO family protein
LPVCETLLNREFSAGQSGHKWVSDLMHLHSTDGWIYLTVVMDLFDRTIID